MNLSARNKLLITVGAVAIVAVLLVVFLVIPQYSKVSGLNAQIDQANADIASAQGLLEQRQQIKSRAAETDVELLRLLNAVPESPELPGYLVEAQDVCIEAGTWLDSATPQQTMVADGYSVVPIEMEILGNWADTVDAIRRIQGLSRQTRIVEFSSRHDAAADHPVPLPPFPVRTTLRLEIYYIPSNTSTSTTTPGATPPAPTQ